MASVDLLALEKKVVGILCENGVDVYEEYLKRFDLIDFFNEVEKQCIAASNFKDIYRDPKVEGLQLHGPTITKYPFTEIKFSPGIREEIIKFIKHCSSSIKIAVFMFTDRIIFQSICEKKLSHPDVNVQILIDDKQFADFMKMATAVIKKSLKQQNLGINVKAINKQPDTSSKNKEGRAHEKFMIIDELKIVTGSYNFTWTSEFINHEQVIISNDK